MKTKLVPFVPPSESTIYDPPLFVFINGDGKYIYAYVKGICYPFVTERGGYSGDANIKIEVEVKPERMTKWQIFQLLNRGGWILKDINGNIGLTPIVHEGSINEEVHSGVKVSRLDKIEWIEPTTDLL